MNINLLIGILVLKLIKNEITVTKPFATDLYLKFEDMGINKEQYLFLNKRLNNYISYIDCEYSLTSNMQYDEFLRILSIELTIIIPNRLMPKEVDKVKQLITVKINRFIKFYVRTILSLNYKKRKESDLNPSCISA